MNSFLTTVTNFGIVWLSIFVVLSGYVLLGILFYFLLCYLDKSTSYTSGAVLIFLAWPIVVPLILVVLFFEFLSKERSGGIFKPIIKLGEEISKRDWRFRK